MASLSSEFAHFTSPVAKHIVSSLLIVPATATVVWTITTYPLGAVWLGGGLLIYAGVLVRWPGAWLLLMMAALPVLDFAPWTGRFFFDEFDCMILVTFVVAGLRRSTNQPVGSAISFSSLTPFIFALFLLSTLAAIITGAAPLVAPDINAFNSYYSPYNALRVGKGLQRTSRWQRDRVGSAAHTAYPTGT
jgi:hypothetical protein